MLSLKVRILNSGREISVNAPENVVIGVLKQKLQGATGIPIDGQRLIFRGRVLTNDMQLADCGLHNDDTLFLVPPPPDTRAGPPRPSISVRRVSSRVPISGISLHLHVTPSDFHLLPEQIRTFMRTVNSAPSSVTTDNIPLQTNTDVSSTSQTPISHADEEVNEGVGLIMNSVRATVAILRQMLPQNNVDEDSLRFLDTVTGDTPLSTLMRGVVTSLGLSVEEELPSSDPMSSVLEVFTLRDFAAVMGERWDVLDSVHTPLREILENLRKEGEDVYEMLSATSVRITDTLIADDSEEVFQSYGTSMENCRRKIKSLILNFLKNLWEGEAQGFGLICAKHLSALVRAAIEGVEQNQVIFLASILRLFLVRVGRNQQALPVPPSIVISPLCGVLVRFAERTQPVVVQEEIIQPQEDHHVGTFNSEQQDNTGEEESLDNEPSSPLPVPQEEQIREDMDSTLLEVFTEQEIQEMEEDRRVGRKWKEDGRPDISNS